MFTRSASIAILIAATALTACQQPRREDRVIIGAVTGAAVGLLTAEALNADRDWRIIAVLAGAAAGALVARNDVTGDCAYARGDGTYYTRPCRR